MRRQGKIEGFWIAALFFWVIAGFLIWLPVSGAWPFTKHRSSAVQVDPRLSRFVQVIPLNAIQPAPGTPESAAEKLAEHCIDIGKPSANFDRSLKKNESTTVTVTLTVPLQQPPIHCPNLKPWLDADPNPVLKDDSSAIRVIEPGQSVAWEWVVSFSQPGTQKATLKFDMPLGGATFELPEEYDQTMKFDVKNTHAYVRDLRDVAVSFVIPLIPIFITRDLLFRHKGKHIRHDRAAA